MWSLKVNDILTPRFSTIEGGKEIEEMKFFNTKNEPIRKSTDLDRWFKKKSREQFLMKIEEFQQQKSQDIG